jgi:hypothetical protein
MWRGGIMTKKGKKKEPKKKGKNTYEVQLSEYGTMAYRAYVSIEADSEEEAVITAEKMAEEGKVEFDYDDGDCVDGWEHQVENVVET